MTYTSDISDKEFKGYSKGYSKEINARLGYKQWGHINAMTNLLVLMKYILARMMILRHMKKSRNDMRHFFLRELYEISQAIWMVV